MEIEHCSFPDELCYDLENNTWMRTVSNDEVIVGVTSILSAIAGRLTQARLRDKGTVVARGRSVGTLESLKFVGAVVSPLSGTLLATNDLVVKNPKVLNDSPYDKGWIARLAPSNLQIEQGLLSNVTEGEKTFREKISQFRARCFKAFPDHEMYEIGAECSAVLVRLNDMMETIPIRDVVHLVSDDPTAYVEMVRWTDQTGHILVDWRTEGNLFHFIIRKTR